LRKLCASSNTSCLVGREGGCIPGRQGTEWKCGDDNVPRAISFGIYWRANDLVISGRKLPALAGVNLISVVKYDVKWKLSVLTTRNYPTAIHKVV
jgi:hypothetical protein